MELEMLANDAEYFAERMRAIRLAHDLDDGYDMEVCHRMMDQLMCEMLRNLGFEEGIDIFESTPKWYA